jgi:hypothetical protein
MLVLEHLWKGITGRLRLSTTIREKENGKIAMENYLLQHGWFVPVDGGGVHPSVALSWILWLLAGAIFHVLNLTMGRKILAHSDGGGMDAGTDYSYVPDLKKEYSIVYKENSFTGEKGYFLQNLRIKMLWSTCATIFAPFTVISWFLLVLFPRVVYFFTQEVTPYAYSYTRVSGEKSEWEDDHGS